MKEIDIHRSNFQTETITVNVTRVAYRGIAAEHSDDDDISLYLIIYNISIITIIKYVNN